MKILIPAYEPNEKLIELVEGIQKLTDTPIIVIDDGSGDNYKDIFQRLKEKNIIILTHRQNKGKGEAIKTGLKYLIQIKEKEGVVFADCDGQHKSSDIIRVLNETKETKSIVLGYRTFKEKVPLRSKIGNEFSKVIFRLMTGCNVKDTQTGLRGYPAENFEWMLKIEGSRYDYEFNILLQLCENKLLYRQIQIDTIYENNNKVSHFNPIKDSILIYKSVAMYVISSLFAAMIDFILLISFKMLLKDLLVSIILSRGISSVVNFWCNKNLVFKRESNKNLIVTVIKYYTLVIVIMILNYLLLNFLYTNIGFNLILSKILTEIILYILSFVMQKRVIFKKNN